MDMEKSSFNNIEQQSIEFVQDALITWVKRLETEANIKLISSTSRNKYFTKLNLNSLLRGDMKTLDGHYKTMADLGVYSINYILDLEDRKPIGTDGDKRLVQLNQTTLDKIGELDVQDKTAIPIPSDEEEGEEDNDETDDETKAKNAREIMVRAMARCLSRETHRATDALKRYNDDRSGLINWMDKFYNQHSDYINDQVILSATEIGIDKIILNDFINSHTQAARLEILNAFDNGEELVFCNDAETLIDSLIRGEA